VHWEALTVFLSMTMSRFLTSNFQPCSEPAKASCSTSFLSSRSSFENLARQPIIQLPWTGMATLPSYRCLDGAMTGGHSVMPTGESVTGGRFVEGLATLLVLVALAAFCCWSSCDCCFLSTSFSLDMRRRSSSSLGVSPSGLTKKLHATWMSRAVDMGWHATWHGLA